MISESLTSSTIVLILSHDLDDYSLIPHPVRKEFSLGAISTMTVESHEMGIAKTNVGLKFDNFLSKKVKGYFCRPSAVIVDGLLNSYKGEGLVIVQLVPELDSYAQMAEIYAKMLGHTELQIIAQRRETVAQRLAEHQLISLIGVLSCMKEMRNNPFLNEGNLRGSEWMSSPGVKKFLSDEKELNRVLMTLKVDYLLYGFNPTLMSLSGLYGPVKHLIQ